MSKTKLLCLTAILLFMLLVVAVYVLAVAVDAAPSAQQNWIGKEYTIGQGETWLSFGRRLRRDGLIHSLLWYRLRLRLQQQLSTLKAGSYTWARFMSTRQIIDFFQVPQAQKTYPVTIPEGLTRREVAELLGQKGVLEPASFLQESARVQKYAAEYQLPIPPRLAGAAESPAGLEGFLFPDTYFLPASYSAPKMVALMLGNFVAQLDKVAADWQSEDAEQLYAKIILASIVQKEYRAEPEAPIIASVFQNRLDRAMRLESCATVVYALTEELGRPKPKRILFADLEVASSYNTYRRAGLPPQPIANMGRVALNAAFHQAQTDYLFFVVQDAEQGTHTFSASFADHQAARESYIRNYFPG